MEKKKKTKFVLFLGKMAAVNYRVEPKGVGSLLSTMKTKVIVLLLCMLMPHADAFVVRPTIYSRMLLQRPQPLSSCSQQLQMVSSDINTKKIQRSFDEIDTAKAGKLGLWELEQVLDDLGYATASDKNDAFAELDFDGDGTVTREEFCNYIRCTDAENKVHSEFTRRFSLYLQKQEAKQKEVARLMGRAWVDTEVGSDGPDQADSVLLSVHSEVSALIQTQAAELETISLRHAQDMADLKARIEEPASHTTFREPGKVSELSTEEELDELLVAAGDLPVIVKFFAPWCRKCMALKPKYINLASVYGNRVVCAEMSVANAEVKEMIKDRMGVSQIPTWQVWKNKELADQYVAGKSIAAVPKALAQMVDQHLPRFSLVKELAELDFDAVDIDRSGSISLKEFESTFSMLGYSHSQIMEAFSYLDFKAMGCINREEFAMFCTQLGNNHENSGAMNTEGTIPVRNPATGMCMHKRHSHFCVHSHIHTHTGPRSRSCARSPPLSFSLPHSPFLTRSSSFALAFTLSLSLCSRSLSRAPSFPCIVSPAHFLRVDY